jgi:spore coat protein U-like protein
LDGLDLTGIGHYRSNLTKEVQQAMKKLLAITIGLAMVLAAGTALADSTTGTANYQVTLVDGCTVDTSGMTTDFGTYFVGDADLVNISAGSVTITCSSGTEYAWGINKGQNAPVTNWLRMQQGATTNYIRYRLTENGSDLGDAGLGAYDFGGTAPATGHSDLWTGSFAYRSGTGDGSPQQYDLRADVNIFGGVAGTYEDEVTVTVYWP